MPEKANSRHKASPVRVVFLGGLGEIGRNCAVIEQQGRLLVLDCGVMFPDPEMPGVDLVLPSYPLTYHPTSLEQVFEDTRRLIDSTWNG